VNAHPRIFLAPFQGITGVTFRSVYVKHFGGVDKLFTPFFTAIQHKNKLPARKLAELGSPSENGTEVVPQILSKDADEIIRFASFCKSLGFQEINWNLGCPYPQVANKKRGSGMLPYPEMVEDILKKVMYEVPVKFSVKCRLGYHDFNEIFKLIPIFNQYNISELTIHARVGKQLYSGNPDPGVFLRAKELLTAPVVYNGDIFSLNDFHQMDQKFSSVSTWMIGRGLLYNPFLPAEIKGIQITSGRKEHIRRFMDDLYYSYRKHMNDNLSAISVLKEYWSYLSMSFNDPHKVFRLVKKVKSFDEYEEAVSLIFSEFEWSGYAASVKG